MAKTDFTGLPINLAASVSYADDAIVSKTLLDKKAGTLTLFAFDAGQGLSEHTSPYDATVLVVEGEAVLMIGGIGKALVAAMRSIATSPAGTVREISFGSGPVVWCCHKSRTKRVADSSRPSSARETFTSAGAACWVQSTTVWLPS